MGDSIGTSPGSTFENEHSRKIHRRVALQERRKVHSMETVSSTDSKVPRDEGTKREHSKLRSFMES